MADRRRAAAVTAVLLAAALAGCSGNSDSGGPPTPAPSSGATVTTASGPLGTILVDGQGRTLYLWEADTSARSTCTGDCAKAWPPLTVSGKPTAGAGVDAALLGTTKRADGSTQITFHRHPLYRFGGDTGAGETNGQGSTAFGAAWYVLDASGNRVTTPAPSASSSVPGGGY
ncbi:hypothetical protein [Streptomyces sp. NPDC057682]|uniref:COG4315 family predicted lipoprotein n=1 Tax=unclassified Streptomyces TaxID=2593676 RepID=UPI0036610A25